MALRKIMTEQEAPLNKNCRLVTSFDDRLHTLIDDMVETLKASDGVGLAAPQVGVLRRVVIVLDGENYLELVNPEIILQEGEQDGLEGCLSVPDVWGLVKRPEHVIVRAQDRDGNTFEAEGWDLTARAFCHELDHLDGHLFTEKVYHYLEGEELEEYLQAQNADADEDGFSEEASER